MNKYSKICSGIFSVILLLPITSLNAQNSSKSNALIEEVTVTARKKEESSQDVPLSITALNEAQLEILKFRDFNDISVGIPNLAADDIGTTKGTANFSIRGLGINSSIASVDPTVGIFLDGVYMGSNAGMVLDMFDISSIEVVRGPQGTLFGKNVTAGAILVNTSLPGDELSQKARISIDGGGQGGKNKVMQYSASLPINDTLKAKISLHKSDDDGYFKNSFDGSNHGQFAMDMARIALVYSPNDDFDMTLRLENSESDGSGSVGQCHTGANGSGCDVGPVPWLVGTNSTFDRDSFGVNNNNPGFQKTENDMVTLTINRYTDAGTWTNIFNTRDYFTRLNIDVDARSIDVFNAPGSSSFDQMSNELRFVGALSDNLNITAGLFIYESNIMNNDNRELYGERFGNTGVYIWQTGGGTHTVDQTSLFSTFDYAVNDKLELTAGVRFTSEDKSVNLVSLNLNQTGVSPTPGCSVDGSVQPLCVADYVDNDTWDTTSPKIGFNYKDSDSSMVYGYWARGYRSGGYNMRNSADLAVFPAAAPKSDGETTTTLEFGYKKQFENGKVNYAIFKTDVEDSQRLTNVQDPTSGVAQIVKNAGDIDFWGIEIDGAFAITDTLTMLASIGYVNSKYSSIISDLSGDNIVNYVDYDLKIPRAAPLTYSFSMTKDGVFAGWDTVSRISLNHRDKSYYNENNEGFVNELNMINVGMDFYSPDGKTNIGVYGKNLGNDVIHGGDTNLSFGGTFSPISKGKVIGVELNYNF